MQGRRVSVRDGSRIITASTQGAEVGGTLVVSALESVELSGEGVDGFPSGFLTEIEGSPAGGNLMINTGQLIANTSSVTLAGGSVTIGTGPLIVVPGTKVTAVPEPSSTLGILAFAAFSAVKVLKCKLRNRH